ncbi:MAG: hypothetical protein TREMPRED_004254 [Tremellales sp. Tagirdzhanova-0007]|nr:MAG: hypothetical protein TREMPRED_004254 [Tremellales sp. Tagirdzhanova-0007]
MVARGIGLGLGLLNAEHDEPIIMYVILTKQIILCYLLNPAASLSQPPFLAPAGGGPRSLGTRKSFHSSPSPNLPPTQYTRDPTTNPLIPLPPTVRPLNSPHLDLSIAHISPAQHLRQMKKRSIAARSFTTSGGLGSLGPQVEGSMGIGPISPIMEPSSPTIPASPTLGSSSPVSSPAMEDRVDLLGPSIALSVVVGLLLIGISTWAGLAYRRRLIRARSRADEETGGPAKNLEPFSASNVFEKGLVPRLSSSSADSDSSNKSDTTIRPTSTSSQEPQEGQSRRVTFIEVPIHTDSMMDLHNKLYEPSTGDEARTGRSRSSTLSAIESALPGPRDSIGTWISTVLDDIEEEGSLRSSISQTSLERSVPAITSREDQSPDIARPDSMALSCFSSSYNESSYTISSSRSSMSDLTTLSTISCLSSFPETPRSENFDISPIASPSKAGRKPRARSQTVVNVKQVDVLRTAVGRTMSLQPSRQVVDALHMMTKADDAEKIKALLNLVQKKDESPAISPVSWQAEKEQGVEEEKDADVTLVDEADDGDKSTSQPETGMKTVLFALDKQQASAPSRIVTRSVSFPSKLLSRRKLTMSDVVPSLDLSTRRSELLSKGYFRRALQALRGEQPEGRISKPESPWESPSLTPPPPSTTSILQELQQEIAHRQVELERYLAEIDPGNRESERRSSIDSDATIHSDGFVFDFPSPGWTYTSDVDMPDFDSYYGGYGYGSDDEEGLAANEVESFPSSIAHVPHIRVTSH